MRKTTFILLFISAFLWQSINAQPGGYYLANGFGEADGVNMTNNTPADGIISATIPATKSSDYFLVQWDSWYNKWTNTNAPYNAVFELTFHDNYGGENGKLVSPTEIGKHYTLQIDGLAYENRQAVWMVTDNEPQGFDAEEAITNTAEYVNQGQDVTLNIKLAGNKSPQEKVFVRYSWDNFVNSKVVEAVGDGDTWSIATATIPGADNVHGRKIDYYAYTTTVEATDASKHDLITLRIGKNGSVNYFYTVENAYVTNDDGTWNNINTWLTGIPTQGSTVIINHNVTMDVSQTVASLKIESDKQLTVNVGQTLAVTGQINNIGKLQVNGILQLNNKDVNVTQNPFYDANSILKYDLGSENWRNVGNEWATGEATSGIPYNVVVTTGGASFNPSTTFRQLNGNLTIEENAAFALSDNYSGDLKIKGNFTNRGSFWANDRAIFFNGEAEQTVTPGTHTAATYPYIRIAENAKVSVADESTWNINDLEVNNGATLVGDASATTATVKQVADNHRTYYMGSPVSGAINTGVQTGAESAIVYKEAANDWEYLVSPAIPFATVGKGYGVQVGKGVTDPAVTTLSFTGALNNGNIDIEITKSGPGFNFLSNPYPSYLDASKVVESDNVEKTLWFYSRTYKGTGTDDPSVYTFATYNPEANVPVPVPATGNNGYIPPLQGFWVRATDAVTVPTNFTFTNNMRVAKVEGAPGFRAPQASERQLLRLQLSNGTVTDEAAILFSENATQDWNSSKMMNPDLNIYTVKAGENLVLNSGTAIEYDVETAVGVKAEAGAYTFSANEFKNFGAEKAYLLDKVANVSTDLSTSDYTVNFAEAYQGTDRFALVFPRSGVITGLENAEAAGFFAFANANRISVNSDAQSGMLYVFNSVGQQVAAQAVSGKLTTVTTALPAGVYVVKLNNLTTKVVVR